jgi:serine/threonine protein phosphatase 1
LQAPSLPKDQLLYAIGDIHGRSDLLAMLLAKVEVDAAEAKGVERKTLVFLGDYVDRGPDSSGVVEMLLSGLPSGFDAHFLKGNHEAILLDFLDDPACLNQWLVNGAEATMQSYGVDVVSLKGDNAKPETWRQAFVAALPTRHRHFFESLELMTSFGDYLFVHAGLRPGVPIDAQMPKDLLWIRHEFLKWDEPFGKLVVHGHTPVTVPEMCPNRIGIDTGAAFTGRLTALRLEGSSQSFLHT